MEIFKILPENERNNFANPRQYVDGGHIPVDKPDFDMCLQACGSNILAVLKQQETKLTLYGSPPVYVRMLFDHFKEEQLFWHGPAMEFEVSIDSHTTLKLYYCALKLLCNSGYIRLSRASWDSGFQRFGNRMVVKYHATAGDEVRKWALK